MQIDKIFRQKCVLSETGSNRQKRENFRNFREVQVHTFIFKSDPLFSLKKKKLLLPLISP